MNRTVALCYVRISLERGGEHSPERQRANIQREAEYLNLTPEWYEDTEGYRSGRHKRTRPGWRDLEKQIDRGDVAAVIVESISRAGRNRIHLLQFAEECDRRGIAFFSVREHIDYSTPHGKHIFAIVASNAQYESDILSDRVASTIEYMRSEEARHYGTVPFGCDREDGKLLPTEDGCWWHVGHSEWIEADECPGEGWEWRGYHDALYRAYEVYATGEHGFAATATILSVEGFGYRGYRGPRMFAYSEVRRILTLYLTYSGHLTRGSPTNPYDGQEVEIIAYNAWEPIVPLPLIQRAVAIWQSRSPGYRQREYSKYRTYEISGLLRCAACKQKLRGAHIHGNYYYRHRAKGDLCKADAYYVRAAKAEEAVLDFLSEHLDFSTISGDIDAYGRAQQTLDTLRDDTETQRERLSTRRDRLIDAYADGTIDKYELESRLDRITEQLASLNERDEQFASAFTVPIDLPESLSETLIRLTPEQRREFYRLLLERIELDIDTITVDSIVLKPWAKGFYDRR